LIAPCKHPIREAAAFLVNEAVEHSLQAMCSPAQKFFDSCAYLSGAIRQKRKRALMHFATKLKRLI